MWNLKSKLSFCGAVLKAALIEKSAGLLAPRTNQSQKNILHLRSWVLGALLLSMTAVSESATISEGFTDSIAPGWVLGNNACLTASTTVACGSNNTTATAVSGNDTAGNGWLRLTSAAENQKGFAYYDVPVNPTQGLTVSFEYATYGGKGIGSYASAGPAGADGIAFFMFDASQTFKLGAFGSSLGYADNKTNSGGSGMAGGYFGVGFDEFGSWPDAKSHACSGPANGAGSGYGAGTSQWPNTIGVRGPVGATAATSYCWLGNQTTYSPIPGGVGSVNFSRWSGPNDSTNAYRKATVTLTPNAGSYTIKVDLLQANGVTLTPVSSVTVPGTAPASLKFGFSASTGGAVNYHEIRNFSYASMQAAPPKLSISKSGPAKFASGGTATYTVNVSNAPSADPTTGDVGFIDALPTGYTFASAPASASNNGFTCTTGVTPNQVACTSSSPIFGGVTKAVTFTVNVATGLALNTAVVNQVQIDPTKSGGDTAAASANCPQFNSALDVSSTAVWTSAQSTDKYCAASLSRIIEPKLSIAKSGPAKFAAGGTATYTVSVSNATGLVPTVGAVGFIDTLPTGYTFASAPVSTSNNDFTCTAGTNPNDVVCTTSTPIASPATKAVTFTVNVPTGLALNTAMLNQVKIDPTKAGGDSTVQNCTTLNTSTLTTAGATAQSTDKQCAAFNSLITEPKLSIAKSGPPRVQSGGTATYTVTVSNATGLAATIGDVSFIDTLPAGYTFASAPVSASNNGFTCAAGTNPNDVVCTTSTPIASPATKAVTFTVNVPSGLAIGSSVLNQVRIDPTKTGGDSTVQNCTTLNTTTLALGSAGQSTDKQCAAYNSQVSTQFDVSKALTAAKSYIGTGGTTVATASGTNTIGSTNFPTTLSTWAVRPSDELTYTITTKEQVGTASTATITETVPEGATYFGPATEGWSCPVGSVAGTSCNKTISLAANATVTSAFTVKMRLTPMPLPSPIINTVTVPGSNCLVAGDCVATNVARTPTLAVTKSGPASLTAGGTATYTVTVNNAATFPGTIQSGLETSGTLSFIDTLPAGFTFASAPAAATANGFFTCNAGASSNQVVCTTTTNIPTNTTKTVTFTVNVPTTLSNGGTVLNSVQIDPVNNGGDTRTPNCSTINSTTLAAGASTQSTDKLCAVAKASTVNTAPSLLKTLSSVTPAAGGAAITTNLTSYVVKPGDKLTYKITASSGTAVTMYMTETVPVGTTYFGPSEGWAACAAGAAAGTSCTQSVTLNGTQNIDTFFTVLADGTALPASISNSVSAPGTNCAVAGSCVATNPVALKVAISKQFTDATGNPSSAQPSAGESIYYKVAITHVNGAATSGALSFTDTLPQGFVFDSVVTATGGLTCTNNSTTRVLTCSTSTALAPQNSIYVLYKVNIGASAVGSQTNAVILTALGGDATTPSTTGLVANQSGVSSNSTAAQAVVNVQAVPVLVKSLASVTPAAGGAAITSNLSTYAVKLGDKLTYKITASSGSAATVTMTETVPAGTTYFGPSEGWSCSVGAVASSSCTQAVTLAPSTPVDIFFTVLADSASLPATISNNVTAPGTTCLVATSCAVTNAVAPKIAISKQFTDASGNPSSVQPSAGDSVYYKVAISHVTGAATSGVLSFSDTLPQGFVYNSVMSATGGLTCSYNSTTRVISCSTSTSLAPQGSIEVVYKVTIGATAAGNQTNAVILTALGGDVTTPSTTGLVANQSGVSSNSTAAQTVVNVRSVPSLVKSLYSVVPAGGGAAITANLSSYVVKAGDKLTYKITSSASTAQTVTMTETVPTGTSYFGPSEGWSCAAGSTAATSCTQAVALNGTQSADTFFTVLVDSTNVPASISNHVTAPGTNCLLATSCAVSNAVAPKIAISKQLTDAAGTTISAQPSVGDSIYYKVAVTQVSGAATSGVLSFADTLPQGFAYEALVAATGGLTCTYNSSTRVIACSTSNVLAPQSSFYVIYKVGIGATATGNQTNAVILTALGGDATTPSTVGLNTNQSGGSSNSTAAQIVVNVQGPVALNVSKTLTNVLRNSSNITTGLASIQVQNGDVLTYSIAAQAISGNYNGVILTETLPANTSYTGGSSQGWTVGAGGVYTQSVNVLANTTETKTFTVTVGNLAAGQMSVNNTVTAQNPSGSTNPSVPNCSSCSVSNPTPPLLRISKTGATNLLAGLSSRYTVTLTNNGGSATSGVMSFNDLLPVGVWFNGTSQTSNGFACSVTPATASNPTTAQTISCTKSSSVLNPGESVAVSYFVTAQSSASTTAAALVNSASLVAGQAGGDTRTPNCSTLAASTLLAGESAQSTDGMCAKTAATLVVGKTAFLKELTQIKRAGTSYTSANLPASVTTIDSMPVMMGDEITYTITATNVDDADSLATIATETVPANTTYASGAYTPTSGPAVAWAGCFAGAAAGTSCTLALPLIPGKLSNGGVPKSLTATFVVTVGALPTTANLKISNTITSAYTSYSPEPPVCLTCTVNTPTVPKLEFSQQYTSTTVAPGGSVSLNVSIHNNGGSGTFGAITFTETLPLGMSLAGSSISSNGFTCTANGASPQVVTCTSSGAIASGAAASVVIPLTANTAISGSDLNAKLVATAIANDPRTVQSTCTSACTIANAVVGGSTAASSTVNTSSGVGILDASGLFSNAAINVVQGALSTTKTLYQIRRGATLIFASPSSVVQPGDQLTYRISVTETSGTAATTILTDVVPANTKYTGLSGEAWMNCAVGSNAAAGTSCTQSVTALANRIKDVYFTVTVDASLPLTALTIGNVVASSAGTCGSACSVSNPTPPVINVEKLANQAAIETLKTGTYTVKIYNRGGSVTTGNIKFADTLPTGLAFVSATGTNFTCTAAGQVVTCEYAGTIAVGANTSVTYTVRSTGAATTGLINDVIVDATLKGGDVRSNTDTSASAANPTAAGSTGGTVSASGFSAKAMINISPSTTSSISGKAKKVGGGGVRGQVGVTVQLKNGAGQPILDANSQPIVAVTDANGDYQFNDLTPGQTYAVTFVPPAGTATAAPENTAGPNGVASANTITAITAPAAGLVIPQQNSVIVDPSGVVYNAASRAAVAGAKVYLFAPNGSLVPDALLDQTYGTVNGAVTAADGAYKLYLKDTATSGTYTLKVVPPGCTMASSSPFAITCPSSSAYKASTASGTSSVIVDESTVNGAYSPNLGGGTELIQTQLTAPSGSQPTTYYTSFAFVFVAGDATNTSNGVANNHLPIDPVANLTISKTALTGLVPNVPASYVVTVANSAGVGTAAGATMLEKIPAGLVLNSITGTGWICTNQDGSALNLPAAGEIVVKCTSTTPIAAGSNANAITVNFTPDGSVTAIETYSSVDPRGGSAPQTPQDPAQCTPTSACAKNGATVAQLSLGNATLFLQKTASISSAEIGDSVLYTLMLEHKAGTPQTGTKIVDTLPLGFKYISGTVKMTRSGSVSSTASGDSALGVTGVGPVLNFNIGDMVLGDLVTLTYRVRLAVGSQQGTGINRAIANTASGSTSNEARATVKVTNGVFTQEGCITGKVYLDCNHNGIQDQQDGDEPGVGGVRLYMEDGTYMVSDRQGKYSICGIQAATHVLKLDKTTLPTGAQLGITANRNALDPDSIFVDMKYGELHRADFSINNCTADVVNQVTSRTDKSGAPVSANPQGNTKVPTKSQSFSSKEQSTNRKFDGEGK